MTTKMRRFQLHRDQDASGVSGTGVVAEGVEFTNGMCALTPTRQHLSVSAYNPLSRHF